MINLLYAGNYKVFDGILIGLLSILKHTKTKLNVYCFTMDLTDLNERFIPISKVQEKYLDDLVKSVNNDSFFKLIDLTKIFKEKMIDSANIDSHFTPYSMLRLFADEVKEIPDKIIYLDTDTVINNDLQSLYDIDIENYEIGCVKDIFNWALPSRWKIKNYFNAGVLLLNMKKIRETGMFIKAKQLCHDKKMLYMDQDALNLSVKYKKMLPVIYNSKDKYNKNIVVHHFCNVRKKSNWLYRIKPWEVEEVKKKMSAYNDILDDYQKRINELKK